MKKWILVSGALAVFGAGCNNGDVKNEEENTPSEVVNNAPSTLAYTIVNIIPHDSTAYTQGLYYHGDQLYEGTGAPKPTHYTSSLRILEPSTGKVRKMLDQKADFFGEGITILNNKLYQLTWTEGKIFVYDPLSFEKVGEFPWSGQGWGITSDGEKLLISDGSSNIRVTNPETMQVEKIIGVYDNNGPVGDLNELEYIDGYLYANQYETDYIHKIDLASGRVVGRADFSGLMARNTSENTQLPKYKFGGAVLNGIAYNEKTGNLYITGKLWPYMFEIRWQ